MKRDIICVLCTKTAKLLYHPNKSKHPGEYVKFVEGIAKRNFTCDHCGEGITQDHACTAFSVWTDSAPYGKWEDDFVKQPFEDQPPGIKYDF